MSENETLFAKLSETNRDVEKISSKMNADAKIYSTKQRFGYFSIPYSASCGDRFYSQGRKKIYRTEDKRVITQPRGIYTKPAKTGINSLFSNEFKQDQKLVEKIADMAKLEREEYLNAIRNARVNKEGNVLFGFKPTGPQEYKDYFHKHPVEYQIPITKQIDKTLKINKATRGVYMENRGIYTKPPKKGDSSFPGVLFGYYKDDEKLIKLKENWVKEDADKRKRSKSKGDEAAKQPFKPASLNKNANFQKDSAMYGEDSNKIQQLVEETTKARINGFKGEKYQKVLPDTAVEQMAPFKPPSLNKSGKDSLFSAVYGVPFIPHEKKVIKIDNKTENAIQRFKPNRLKDSSVFSPPITSFLSNIKKEFPKAFYK